MKDKQLNLTLGAIPKKNSGVEFCVWAPETPALNLLLIHDQQEQRIPMKKNESGYFQIEIARKEQNIFYYYEFPNHIKYPDPASRYQPYGIFGPSQVIDLPPLKAWSGIPLEQYIIYELHVGVYSHTHNLMGIIPYLPKLKSLGITAIELMPIAQFPGNRNWGYDCVFIFAVHNTYGGPLALQTFVNACHEQGLAVILDVVYNHFGPEGSVIEHFGPYFTDRYQNPWGKSINFDDAYSDPIRRFFIENALYWFQEFAIDALRLDALHAIYDHSAYPFLHELADHIHALGKKTGRQIYLIGESDLNDSKLIRAPKKGGFGLDAQWNDDFHHALHALLTHEKNGYYQDFGKLDQFAKAYQNAYVYDGQYSSYRKRRHGNSTKHIAGKRFVVFSQNHDQVGNRLFGDRLSQKLSLPQLKLAASLVILSPYLPLLFMGEEYGEMAPFQYFVHHSNPDLIAAVRNGRQQEFSSFNWDQIIPDPQSEETFQKCQLHHELIHDPQHAQLWHYYQRIIALRKQTPALTHLSKTMIDIEIDQENNSLLIQRIHELTPAFIFCHFNNHSTSIKMTQKYPLHFLFYSEENVLLPELLIQGDHLQLPPFGLAIYQKLQE